MFHSLCRRFDRHVFPLFVTAVYGGTRAWNEIERQVWRSMEGSRWATYVLLMHYSAVEFCFSYSEL